MTVAELAAALTRCDQDVDVWFAAAENATVPVCEVDSSDSGRVVLYGPAD